MYRALARLRGSACANTRAQLRRADGVSRARGRLERERERESAFGDACVCRDAHTLHVARFGEFRYLSARE